MAVIAFTGAQALGLNQTANVVGWIALSTDDSGKPVEMPTHSDRSVQVDGTFAGATVLIEGSNDGMNYYTLTDPQGSPLSISTGKLKQILEVTRFIRPRVSGGGGTDINVTLLVVRK